MIEQSQTAEPRTQGSRTGFACTAAQIVLSAIGVIDAGLLFLEDRKVVDLPCTANGGCEQVAASSYAHLSVLGHDIPLAAAGVAGYVLLLTLAMAKAASETSKGVRTLSIALLAVSGIATAYSWYLQYVAKYIIGAFCVYCRASACIMTLIFIVSAIDRRRAGGAETSLSNKA